MGKVPEFQGPEARSGLSTTPGNGTDLNAKGRYVAPT
jgi:hypothetical protein